MPKLRRISDLRLDSCSTVAIIFENPRLGRSKKLLNKNMYCVIKEVSSPVCGFNGVQYESLCMALASGTGVDYRGPCIHTRHHNIVKSTLFLIPSFIYSPCEELLYSNLELEWNRENFKLTLPGIMCLKFSVEYSLETLSSPIFPKIYLKK